MHYSQGHPPVCAGRVRVPDHRLVALRVQHDAAHTESREPAPARWVLRTVVTALTALLAVSLATVETADDSISAGSGTIQAVARVVEVGAARQAATLVSEAAEALELQLRADKQVLTDPARRASSLQQFEREQVVGGGTVHIEYLPPSSSAPATLQVEWTSN